ncbi:MAG: hypothetical protein ACTSVE_11960 [Candidatus Helarchaeota archaeon]
MIKYEENFQNQIFNKNFSDIQVGDRVVAVAKIIDIKKDEKNEQPQWYLLSLFDGTRIIRIFTKDIASFKVNDIVKVDFSVKNGKPYNGRPQFAYELFSISKSDHVPHILTKLEPKGILRKSELKELKDGQKIKLYTKVLTLSPKNGTRDKNQKILITDIENKPISLWLFKNHLKEFEELKKDEYFLLAATVKKVPQNENASFLVFDNLIKGKDANKDIVARAFFEERIRYYSQEMLRFLRLRKENFDDRGFNFEMLISMLELFRKEVYEQDTIPNLKNS